MIVLGSVAIDTTTEHDRRIASVRGAESEMRAAGVMIIATETRNGAKARLMRGADEVMTARDLLQRAMRGDLSR